LVLIGAFLPLSSRSKLISAAGANRVTVVMPGPCDVAAEKLRIIEEAIAFFSVTVVEREFDRGLVLAVTERAPIRQGALV
jgi:hypothetical protein